MNTKIPFDNLSFSLLTEDIDVSLFQCRELDLTEFLVEDALENQAARLSVTRIVSYEEQIVGFFTLTNDCIIRKGISDNDGEEWYPYPHYPALKIARLATHREFEGRGICRAMLLKTVAIAMRLSQYVGCRMITVDAKPKSEGFYLCGVEGAEREDPLRKLGDGSGAPSFCFTFTPHGSSLYQRTRDYSCDNRQERF